MNAKMRGWKRLGTILGALLLTVILGGIVFGVTLGSQAAPLENTPLVGDIPPRREAFDDIQSPAISFIDSPSATCIKPVERTGACYIQWDYLNVTAASGQYIISMTVAIDNHIRLYTSGFFQTFVYIPGEMMGPGYLVTCGFPGSGGLANMGNSYSYVIRARETGGLTAANYGSVTCPADTIDAFIPVIQKKVRH